MRVTKREYEVTFFIFEAMPSVMLFAQSVLNKRTEFSILHIFLTLLVFRGVSIPEYILFTQILILHVNKYVCTVNMQVKSVIFIAYQ